MPDPTPVTLADLIDQHIAIEREAAAARERERLSQDRLWKALESTSPVAHAGYVWYRDITRMRVATEPEYSWRGSTPSRAGEVVVGSPPA